MAPVSSSNSAKLAAFSNVIPTASIRSLVGAWATTATASPSRNCCGVWG